MCQTEDENMNHFRACIAHEKVPFEITWTNFFFKNYPKEQNLIAVEVRKRYNIGQMKINEFGLSPLNLAPLLQ